MDYVLNKYMLEDFSAISYWRVAFSLMFEHVSTSSMVVVILDWKNKSGFHSCENHGSFRHINGLARVAN